MAQFVAFDSNVEISPRAIQAVFRGISLASDKISTEAIFQKYGLFPLDETTWFPQQNCLDMLRELSFHTDLVAVGMQIPDPTLFPQVNTVAEALNLINAGYQKDHRGGVSGEYRFIQIDNSAGRLICHNPYPADMDFGLLYALLKHYQHNDEMRIEWDPLRPTRKNGADSCEFIIEW